MGNLHDLMLLVLLGAVIASWLSLSRSRELAVAEARRYCERHGLQLLDETVGLRAWRLRRIDGRRTIERGYGFDVSVDGDDREHGRLWMSGRHVTEMDLPTIHWLDGGASQDTEEAATGHPATNVIPFPPRARDGRHRPH